MNPSNRNNVQLLLGESITQVNILGSDFSIKRANLIEL